MDGKKEILLWLHRCCLTTSAPLNTLPMDHSRAPYTLMRDSVSSMSALFRTQWTLSSCGCSSSMTDLNSSEISGKITRRYYFPFS
jgi:hypothetical protein